VVADFLLSPAKDQRDMIKGRKLKTPVLRKIKWFFKRPHGCRLPMSINRVFEIEIDRRSLPGDHPCNRGFSALPGAEKGGNGMNPEGFVDSFKHPGS